ncbi:MAG: cyclic nucleotide-binding domain-containing protein [Imperialibacter sp.]|uniref:cyclic nucleotide-binding domain-containing protein n=1 Tax=Imperialibacter sp. TaxID=2038411 RepID=UPI0032ED5E84
MLKSILNPFRRSYNSEELNLFGFLQKVRLFERLSYEEMALFVPYLYLRQYKNEEAVFFRGDPSHALYIIKSGEIALNIDVKDKFEELSRIYPGDAFGDNTVIESATRIFTSVVVSDNAELYVIPQVNLLQIMNDNTVIRAKVMTSFAEIYNAYSANLVKSYRNHFGFFDLSLAYKRR